MSAENNYQTILGFDFGTKYIGIAVGQTITKSAKPLTTLFAVAGIPKWEELSRLIKEWRPNALVVGIPLNMDGTQQPITFKALYFAEQLKEKYKLPVYEIDERLTTIDARSQIFAAKGYKGLTKTAIDSFAAKLILDDWLSQY